MLRFFFSVFLYSAVFEIFQRTQNFTTILSLTFAVLGYFVVIFALRFVYPSFSLEGKKAPIIWSCPIHLHEIFSWKFFFWGTLILGFTEIVTLIVALSFSLATALISFLMFMVFFVAAVITMIALGQGVIFPRFKTCEPDSFSTSLGGMMTTFLSLGYLWIIGRYIHQILGSYFISGYIDILGMFGILIVSLALVSMYWIIALLVIQKHEL